MMEDDGDVRETGSHSPFKEARNSRAEKTHWKRDPERGSGTPSGSQWSRGPHGPRRQSWPTVAPRESLRPALAYSELLSWNLTCGSPNEFTELDF